MRKSLPSQVSLLVEKHKKLLEQRKKYVKNDFQAYGLMLSEQLHDPQHKSLYIRLAKTHDHTLLEKARLFVKDQSPQTIHSPGRLFMWKLKDLKNLEAANTPTEIIDIVNESDSVIGTATKAEANANPALIHREIAILIYNEKREVLFQKRSKYKKFLPQVWTLGVAGHIKSGQPPEVAAKNELYEELGIKKSVLKYVRKDLMHYKTESHFCYLFICEISSSVRFKLNTAEVDKVHFFSPTILKTYLSQGENFDQGSIDDAQKFWAGEL